MPLGSPIRVGAAVAAALAEGGPVVALESTIICHGMPYPANHTTAVALEAAVRAAGAVPATVALLAGVPTVGVDAAGLAHLAASGGGVRKVGRRGLAAAVAAGVDGATTVSATAAVAAAVGVRVFATGGLGGVHRGVAASWDISEDVAALAAVRVAVVCAGIKSLVDVAKSLEALESAGVGVYTLLTEAEGGGDGRGGDGSSGELSGGASLAANVALAKNNAAVAGRLAVAYAAARRRAAGAGAGVPTLSSVSPPLAPALLVGVADMALPATPWLHRAPPPVTAAVATAVVLVVDANVGADDVAAAVAAADPAATLWLEPVSVAKAARLAALPPAVLGRVDWVSPNGAELRGGGGGGARVARTALPAVASVRVASTTGAGDTLVGVVAAAVAAAAAARTDGGGALDGLAGEARVVAALRLGMAGAAESVAGVPAVAGAAQLDWRRLRTAAGVRGRL
ncbi:hypothetical protein I4F81_007652 [Pyropia yezoensis]|uniref:Uncharacterized protein n=1 Tax=Pyropia yezoensis TaxID=2788 RepID=A0ACC3C4M9_PYRYE|nr:hypothetical protein I4F81_007652 [Neopyropia yezoensis]